jgi:lincosamide nucleotidyltransferase A/C/D/E
VPVLRTMLEGRGYKQVREDCPWNFVLADESGREIDVHAFVFDQDRNVVDGIMYPAKSLTGTGIIDGNTVRCISARYMIEFLAPWIEKWPEKYVPDVAALCEKFGIELPEEYKRFEQHKKIVSSG